MTQERINEIRTIVDRAKQYQGINYALDFAVAVHELIEEVKLLQDELKEYNCETKVGCPLIKKVKAELKEAKKELCWACKCLCKATGHGWENSCDECKWHEKGVTP